MNTEEKRDKPLLEHKGRASVVLRPAIRKFAADEENLNKLVNNLLEQHYKVSGKL